MARSIASLFGALRVAGVILERFTALELGERLPGMQSRKLRIGVIGTGGIARAVHVPGWQDIPDVEIVALADVNETLVRKVAKDLGVGPAFTDYRKLLKVDGLDAVDICTPNRMHGPIVLAALAAGKHVLCEKPLATTPAEIEKMIASAKKAKRMLCVMQNNRYRGISVALKRWVDTGGLGDVYYGRAWAIRRNLLPPAVGFISRKLSGGGPCMDIGVHCLDLAMWLMGFPEPVSVAGTMGTHLAHTKIIPGAWGDWDRKVYDVEDFACGLVRFKNGAALTLESSWLGHTPQPEDMSCMILGTKAGVSWPSGQVCTTVNGALVDSVIKPVPIRDATHTSVIHEFYDAIVDKKPSPVPAEQSLKVIRILDGVYRSTKTRKEVTI
jgi:predicted dehydrogenase